MSDLYDNREGYSQEALRISQRFREVAKAVFLEHPEHNALELSALLVSAVEEARVGVSLSRRLDDRLATPAEPLGRDFIIEAARLGPEKGAEKIGKAMETATFRDRMTFFQALRDMRDDEGNLKDDTPPEVVALAEAVKVVLLGIVP